MNILLLWPNRRSERIEKSLNDPDGHRDESDGYIMFRKLGYRVMVKDPYRFPFNPFIDKGSLLSGFDFLRALWVLKNLKKIDVIISAASSSVFFLVLLKKIFKFHQQIMVVDPALDPNSKFRMKIQDIVLPLVDHVFVFGENQKIHLKKKYHIEHVSFIHHRVDLGFFKNEAISGTTVSGDDYILSVGNDVGRDFNTLINACRSKSIKVKIITRLPVPTNENVEIISKRLPWQDYKQLFSGARMVVIPLFNTIHASGINSLLEAMAMGKPVVAASSDGVKDHLIDGYNALTYEPENADQLSNRIGLLLESGEVAKKLSINARTFVAQRCNAIDICKEIEKKFIVFNNH